MRDQCHAYVKHSDTAGNGLFAAKKILPGELIFSLQRPLIAVLDSARFEDTCANCFAWTAESAIGSRGDAAGVSVSACTGCRTLRYCSKVSRDFC